MIGLARPALRELLILLAFTVESRRTCSTLLCGSLRVSAVSSLVRARERRMNDQVDDNEVEESILDVDGISLRDIACPQTRISSPSRF